eukprot:TRINITY_DN7032_c0_g1_i7.p1 TRINITY_DN7032_c0_g1~~TRINITY_DN7032_c0_g1_i7.p1  ORF type:complete len:143 (-),score=30.58 TRINITY_DN7032_c0_g1_i7:23-451(-)
MPIKEYQIVDAFISEEVLKDEMLCVQQVQKSTSAGQRTRFKAFQMVGDHNGHIGIGVRVGKELAVAIKASLISAKLNIVPIRRGYWGNKIGVPHTCLLYTSDAADEEDSVDLGGRRIIKKKNIKRSCVRHVIYKNDKYSVLR